MKIVSILLLLLSINTFAGVSDIYECSTKNDVIVNLGVDPSRYLIMLGGKVFTAKIGSELKIDNRHFAIKAGANKHQILLSIADTKGSLMIGDELINLDCEALH